MVPQVFISTIQQRWFHILKTRIFFNFKYIVHKSLSGYYPGLKQASSIITFEFEIAGGNIDFEIQI
jgi:hypothetical protein